IKIEAREEMEGDSTALGFDFLNLHRNKRSMTLDLKHPRGVEIIKKIAARADVVVENFRPDVKKRLGIDYEALSKVNPRLVYGSISGFGQTGPYANRPGFDQIAQGMGGLMSITGLPGQGPVRVGIPIADLSAGLFCAPGILVSLLEREKSKKGQHITTSLLEAPRPTHVRYGRENRQAHLRRMGRVARQGRRAVRADLLDRRALCRSAGQVSRNGGACEEIEAHHGAPADVAVAHAEQAGGPAA